MFRITDHSLSKRLYRSLFIVSALFFPLFFASAPASPAPPVVGDCSALRGMDFSKLANGEAPTKVMRSEMVVGKKLSEQQAYQNARFSRAMSARIDDDITDLPDHCLVEGYVNPHIKFEMRLPQKEEWNGKFLLVACDGWCGQIEDGATMAGLIRHYATLTHDGGHWGDFPFDAVWAVDNVQAKINFGYRANHVTPIAAKAIINAYYGTMPKRSYLTGCSKGGQAGVMAASRFPYDFDGILSRGPTIDYTGVNILGCGAKEKAVFDEAGNVKMDATKLPILQQAVMRHCDEKDGLKDSLISDPRKCDFDPASIQCEEGKEGHNCLTETEVEVVRALYAPITDCRGNQIYPGSAYGSEFSWRGWSLPVPGAAPLPGGKLTYAQLCGGDFLRYMAFPESKGGDWDWRKNFDWDRDKHLLKEIGSLWDATNPDLRGFRDAGGKMIVVHGWADVAIPAEASIEWYDNVSQFMGGRDKVIGFARLFLLPGASHCGGGLGPEDYDALELLEQWVEQGKAPDVMITNRYDEGKLVRSRPVYPYPIEAKYKGHGSIDEAESFEPYDPR